LGDNKSQTQLFYGQIPALILLNKFESISLSSIYIFPNDFGINPVAMLKHVDFPAPFGPKSPNTYFLEIPNETPFKALKF